MQTQTMADGQTFQSTFTPTDAQGKLGAYIGTPSWNSDNTSVATVVQNTTNPLQATITGVSPGTANISCVVQNPASTPISTPLQVVVTGGPVTGGTFSNTTPS